LCGEEGGEEESGEEAAHAGQRITREEQGA
jgi:hypothetical protein